MLTAEQGFLLSCMADLLRGVPTEAPGTEPDWKEIFRIANEHCVDSLVFTQCRKWLVSNPASSDFRAVFSRHVFYSVNRADFFREIVSRFEAEDIPLVCFKGGVLREHYPEPALRTMGDIDIVIHAEDQEAADRILRKDMGFSRMIDNHAVWTYWTDWFQIEVHNHMFYEELASRQDYRAYFDGIWDHVHNAPVFGVSSPVLYVPDEDFHLLYLMVHTAKHVLNNGSGLRAYLDMALLARDLRDALDWDLVSEELEALELLTFTKTCFSCCERWFKAEMPMRREDLPEDLFETITEKTFRDGVFGLENAENRPASAAKEIRQSESPYTVGALKRGFRKLFPPYRDLQLVPWYSFIDGKPWLLPFVWVYRFFYCGIRKLRHSVKLLAEPFTKKKEVVKRQQLMKEWGL